MSTTCEQTVQMLKEKLIEQDEFIQKVQAAALVPGVVIDKAKDKLLIAVANRTVQANAVKGVDVGSQVMMHPETAQIVSLSQFNRHIGVPCTIEGLLPDGRLEVLHGGEKRVIMASPAIDAAKLEPGATGLLDSSGSVLVDLVSAPKVENAAHTNVQWDQIGGNERAKQELKEAVTMIQGDSKLFAAYGLKAPKGVLLYGPPGCGKTMLGKAVATELGTNAFIYVKAPELLNQYVGATEERIRSLFRSAREHKQRTGQTAVIFVDEADAILQERGTGVSSDMEKTIVPSFLTEMDGLSESAAMVILATNRPDTLDPAVIREGRIDARILIDRPGEEQVAEIFRIGLKGLPLLQCSVDEVAGRFTEALFGTPELKSRVSGAMVATMIERAKRVAVRRDITKGKVTGITIEDIITAIQEGI